MRSKEESQNQRAIIQYIVNKYPQLYIFHIPNGGSRNIREAANLKKDGVKAGVADLCIMLPDGRAAWVEVKSSKGRQTDSQKDFEQICAALNHPYHVVNSVDEGIKVIDIIAKSL